MTRRKKILYIFLPLIFFIMLNIIGFLYIKFRKLFILPCVIHMFTGYYCCGCGGTRSFFAFLNGNLTESIKYNPIVIFGVIILFLKWLELLTDKKIIPENRAFWYTVLGIFLLFYIIRNFFPALAPV